MALSSTPKNSKFQDYQSVIINELEREPGQGLTSLHDYQINAVLSARTDFAFNAGNEGPALIVAPTGSGKTGMVVLLPYVLGSSKALIISPSPIIGRQLAISFGSKGMEECFFHKVNLINNTEGYLNICEKPYLITNTGDVNEGMGLANLVIVNAQKFGGNSNTSLIIEEGNEEKELVKKVKETFKQFNTVIVDEAHHYPAATWRAIVENFIGKQIIFLTATPYRNNEAILPNQRIIFEILKNQIEGITIRRCIFKEKLLENFDKNLTDDHIRTISQDITRTLNEHDIANSEVRHKAMVLVGQINQAKKVARNLDNATYYTSEPEARSNKENFERNLYRIIVVCGSLLEGYDNSDISVCVILRKVKARVAFTQFVGRCLRTSRSNISEFRDPVTAVVLSYTVYNQKRMWDQYRNQESSIAENDPEEDQ